MVEEYGEASRREAEQIAATLKHLDILLASDRLGTVYTGNATELRRTVRKMLVDLRTNLESLASIERDDVFKTNPTFATQRFQLIKNLETIKIDFEFEVVPALQKITEQAVQQRKQKPMATVEENMMPPLPAGQHWTMQKVLDTAEQFLDQAVKAGNIAAKGYALVKSLGLLLGIPLP